MLPSFHFNAVAKQLDWPLQEIAGQHEAEQVDEDPGAGARAKIKHLLQEKGVQNPLIHTVAVDFCKKSFYEFQSMSSAPPYRIRENTISYGLWHWAKGGALFDWFFF